MASDSEDHLSPEDPNTSIDPYQTLEVSSTATEAEIRSAYKKLALRHHPDKVEPAKRDEAHKKFQTVAFAYAVLSDATRRRRYDTTGSLAESALDDEDFDWRDFFAAQYAEISEEKITEFERAYKDGEEERADLLKFYVKHKGKMDRVFEEVMLSNVLKDEERFRVIIEEAIESGEVEGFDAFVNESEKSKRRRFNRAKKEAEEAEEYARALREKKERKKERNRKGQNGKKVEKDDDDDDDEELEVVGSDSGDEDEWEDDEDDDVKPRKKKSREDKKGKTVRSKKASSPPKKAKKGAAGGLNDLAALIQQRQKGRAATFLDDLEAKYAPKGKSGKKRAPVDEPPEEAFAKVGARMSSKKAKSSR